MRRGSKRKSGFTLIETMIALSVILAGSLMFSALFVSAIKSEKMVGNHQQAVSIVQHKVDQLRAVGYGRLNHLELTDAGIVDMVPNTSPYVFNGVDELDSLFPNPVATVEVEDVGPNVRRVTVALAWTGSAYRQGNGELTVVTEIARK